MQEKNNKKKIDLETNKKFNFKNKKKLIKKMKKFF